MVNVGDGNEPIHLLDAGAGGGDLAEIDSEWFFDEHMQAECEQLLGDGQVDMGWGTDHGCVKGGGGESGVERVENGHAIAFGHGGGEGWIWLASGDGAARGFLEAA